MVRWPMAALLCACLVAQAQEVGWNAIGGANSSVSGPQTWQWGTVAVGARFVRFPKGGADCPVGDVGLLYRTRYLQCDAFGNRIRAIELPYDQFDLTDPARPVHVFPNTLSLEVRAPFRSMVVRWVAPMDTTVSVIANFINTMGDAVTPPGELIGQTLVRTSTSPGVSQPLRNQPGIVPFQQRIALRAGQFVDFVYTPVFDLGGIHYAALTVQVLRLDGYRLTP